MRRASSITVAIFFLFGAVAACSSSSNGDASAAGGDGGNSNEAGVTCCPPDPSPGCCMKYGGSQQGGTCPPEVCDGMPEPGDPGWKLVKNSDGCEEWTNTSPSGSFCGEATFDSGHPPDDGGPDGDASSDE